MPEMPRLRAALMTQLWAMDPNWLAAMYEIVENKCEGITLTPDQMRERAIRHSLISQNADVDGIELPNGVATYFGVSHQGSIRAARGGGAQRIQGDAEPGTLIAVINIMGVIAHHASQVESISGPGGTSTQRVGQAFDAAMEDPAVKAIVLHADSPGGGVPGVQELGEKIFAARGRKPIIAQVNSTAASAAYWIVSQADEIVVTPSGQVGSIGVYGQHHDKSAAAEKAGVKVTFFAYPPNKIEGHPFAPPSDEFTSKAMSDVKLTYEAFSGAVARGRGVKRSAVEAGYGKGGVELAANALKLGMVDRIGTMEDTLRRVSKMKVGTTATRRAEGAEIDMVAGDVETTEAAIEPAPVDEAQVAQAAQDLAADAAQEAEANRIAAQTAAERDEFRRRRHAHRQRAAVY